MKEDILHLQFLVSNPNRLSTETLVPLSKHLLWHIGQGLTSLAYQANLVRDEAGGVGNGAGGLWECLASMIDHKLKGSQLQQLYATMKLKGYQEVALPDIELPTGKGGQNAPVVSSMALVLLRRVKDMLACLAASLEVTTPHCRVLQVTPPHCRVLQVPVPPALQPRAPP